MANFDAYRSEGQFRSYLFRTVTNCLRERTRRRRREVQLGSDSQWGPTVPPEMPAIDDDRMAALRRCIGRLAHSLRSVLMLLYFSEQPMSMTQLATVLGTSASAVQKRHWRGMIALRECMESSQEVNGDVV
jgi:RNA polymerase sigma factor (sigma-70 family)